ncbi:MAG TPA: SCP2 sterol-binding domain-containing protein, partial [Acidimicrobiales bacterium]|nr:SCP2 sterol-binding domain-containing protein [Acidimicrobiales bacterium]
MARFLSPAWADEFNVALRGVPGPGPDAGLAAADGHFTMAQEVRGSPDGDVRLILRFDDGALRLRLELEPVDGPDPDGTGADGPGSAPADVVIALSYEDAVAMSKGELTPADALGSGRVRVRGDLSVLVAAQQMLNAARESSLKVGVSTTY